MVIRCKMCGGELRITEGSNICVCEFCGAQQTIPATDNEKKVNLFNRANRLRMNAEFDKAAAVYASITAEFPEEAEAYWGLCLCKYGIEYVDDPLTGKKVPTCHRTLSESILDDSDFDQACENTDPVSKRMYREEAKEIDRLQRGILSIVANEEPYDVFICYKETDENGNRTEDSVLAQNIYDELTGKNMKVFFARITLEDKLGQQYEPYIYAALHSAKVMLVIGTAFEYFDAVWVKNEWARYLDMMRTDRGKTLIPCYKGVDAYDMPQAFRNLQAQDMGKIGWLQDLSRGVLKLCHKDEQKPVVVQQVMQSGNPTADSLLQRAYLFLEENKWEDADKYLERVLDIDPKNPRAYIGKMMSSIKVARIADLRWLKEPFAENESYRKAMRFASERPNDKPFMDQVAFEDNCIRSGIELLSAVENGDVELVRKLLAQGANPNQERKGQDGEQFSVLRDSIIQWPNDEIANLLIDAGADVNFSEKQEECSVPVLISAICKSNVNVVKRLLEKGANPNCERIYKDGKRYSALSSNIIQWPNDEITNLLIDAGADVNYLDQQENSTVPVLVDAIFKGNVNLVKRLLEKGADPNCERIYKDGKRYSALSSNIIQWPNDEIANLLIDAGADVNYSDQQELCTVPVLIDAIDKGNVNMVKRLLEKGADPNCERIYIDGRRYSALSSSIIQCPNNEIANLLIDAGADVNYSDQQEKRAFPVLIDAICKGNVSMVKRLLEKGAAPNCEQIAKDGQRYSALCASVIYWPNDDIANLLIDAGADVNYSEKNEICTVPVLIDGICKGNVNMVKRLLEKGANPNCERILNNGRRYSALSTSIIHYPNDDIANHLIDAGADVNYSDQLDNGTVPVLVDAIFKGNVNMVKRLLEKGAVPNCEQKYKDGRRYSALCASINYWPDDKIAYLLIGAGADVNYTEQQAERTVPVLIDAIGKGNVNMVKQLLEKGANPNCEMICKLGERDSALSASIYRWPNDEIANLLIHAGADVNYSYQRFGAAIPILIYAVSKKNVSMVKWLLEKGADPNCERIEKDGQRYNALYVSIGIWPNKEIARMLSKAGADGTKPVRKRANGVAMNAPIMAHSMIYLVFRECTVSMEDKLDYIEILIDSGARFDNEPDSIKKMKLDKSKYDRAILAKMKKAGWRPMW